EELVVLAIEPRPRAERDIPETGAVGPREVPGGLSLEEQDHRQPRERDEAIEEPEREPDLAGELMRGQLGGDAARRLEHERREAVVEVQDRRRSQVAQPDRPREREAVARGGSRAVLLELERLRGGRAREEQRENEDEASLHGSKLP